MDPSVMPIRIVSGGQTGADRAALDAAIAANVPCGGWCPEGRLAEDGRIPEQYPLCELPGAGYSERTRRNVLDSDGTLIVSYGPPQEGTGLTLRCCQEMGKPSTVIDAGATPIESAVRELVDFVQRHRVRTLNIAGPRASEEPAIVAYVFEVLTQFLAAQAHKP